MPVNFNLEELDDTVLPDGVPSWDGGQFSNWRANLLKPNQSSLLQNCIIDRLGLLTTRHGSVNLGTSAIVSGHPIDGLTFFAAPGYNYVVAAVNGNIYAFIGGAWTQIMLGGLVNGQQLYIGRMGQINNAGGYPVGATTLTVSGITGVVGTQDTLYFLQNIKSNKVPYTIASHVETTGNTTQITLEQTGIQSAVVNGATFVVLRPATVNNTGGYPAGATTAIISGYTGAVNTGEFFYFPGENVLHTISAHTETSGNTTSITWTVPIRGAFTYPSPGTRVTFALGINKLFIFGGGNANGAYWDGATWGNIGGAASPLDQMAGSTYVNTNTAAPTGVTIAVWFQSRLIVAGIAAQPDAVYFSDFLDATSWDHDFQEIRVGGGDSDPITGLVPWTDLQFIVFKTNSIYVVDCDPAQSPDQTDPTLLVGSFAIRKIHSFIGCPAPLTARQVGGASSNPGSDVYFLDSDHKVRSVRRTLAAEFQQELVGDISQPVQDYLNAIYQPSIGSAVGFYHRDHYILFTPWNGSGYPNMGLAFNVQTQTWSGVWFGWLPTCFSVRNDVSAFPKLIYGGQNGNVAQWLDDVGLNDQVTSTFQDADSGGTSALNNITTVILTRAFTFNDPFNFKTGLNAEFEFDQSVAGSVLVQVVLDGQISPSALGTLNTLSSPMLTLPLVLPFTLPVAGLIRKSFDLQSYGTWRELQFRLTSSSQKVGIRSIRLTGFMDTIQLQTH